MTVSFDIARAGDLPQLVELLGILFTQEHELAPDAAKQLRGLEMIVGDPAIGSIYVAREDIHAGAHTGARVLGMVNILRTISTAEGGPAGMLEDFIVRPECRGRGVGAQLLGYAIGRANADGLLRLILLTDGDNVNAQRFYERAGFRRSGMLPMRLKL
jgi:ribosomal protein S18 acetylase RimI-like enzyme